MSSSSDPNAGNPFAAWLPPFMNPASLNPFAGLPGMGALGAGGTPDVSAWMKAIDPSEIEKRIQEMRVVEMWLQTQVNMVQMSIQTMSLQKQSMEALHAAAKGVSDHTAAMGAVVSAPSPKLNPTSKRGSRKRS